MIRALLHRLRGHAPHALHPWGEQGLTVRWRCTCGAQWTESQR